MPLKFHYQTGSIFYGIRPLLTRRPTTSRTTTKSLFLRFIEINISSSGIIKILKREIRGLVGHDLVSSLRGIFPSQLTNKLAILLRCTEYSHDNTF